MYYQPKEELEATAVVPSPGHPVKVQCRGPQGAHYRTRDLNKQDTKTLPHLS